MLVRDQAEGVLIDLLLLLAVGRPQALRKQVVERREARVHSIAVRSLTRAALFATSSLVAPLLGMTSSSGSTARVTSW